MLATPPRSRSRAPAASRSPRFSQVPMVASLPRKSHSESFVRQTRGPALATLPRSRSRTPAPSCSPRFSQVPMVASLPRKSHSEGFVRQTLGAKPSARHPPAARVGSVMEGHRGARPSSAHACFRAGNGEEWGQTHRACNPATLPLKSPQPHRVDPASVRGPWSAIAVARCPLSRGPTAPHGMRRPPGHIVSSGSMRPCRNGGPPPLLFREGRRRIGRGGETPPPHPFSRALAGGPAPVPGVGVAYVRAGQRARAQRGDRGDMGGDMPHYSPPLPFRGGRSGCPCVLDTPRGHQEWGSQMSTLAGVPRPAPRVPARQLCSPFSGVFQFLDRYISLARNIRYVTIKPMTKYCPVFILSLADVQ